MSDHFTPITLPALGAKMTKFDPTKPVQTRDGRKARILHVITEEEKSFGNLPSNYSIIALVDGNNTVTVFNSRGDDFMDRGWPEPNPLDLFNVPEETVEWMNYYPDAGGGGVSFQTMEQAKKMGGLLSIAIFKITKQDGKVVKVELVEDNQ